MAEFLHGAYGQINAVGSRIAAVSRGAFVYVGTAPVHTIEGGANNLNKPVLVNTFAEAKKLFGYSDDWASYTLCEAMKVHLEMNGVGPLVLINVLNPTTHKSGSATTASKTPTNGKITITSAESAILDSVVVKTQDTTPVTKVKNTDYTIAYDSLNKTIVITSIGNGLGTAALTVEYYTIDVSAVTASVLIGSTDNAGTNTGLYAIKNVYALTGQIPAYLAAPGFSSTPTVNEAMHTVSQKINGHWDAYCFADIPLSNSGTPLTLDTAVTYKNSNGYTYENETVYFPMAKGTDGAKYHISVLAAANFQTLLVDSDGIPYRSASNTECAIIENLYFGESVTGRVYDDELINNKLNKNGICSAVFVGGRWVIWGAQSAAYTYSNNPTSYIGVFETNIMMLYYISNDFQARRVFDVDRPMTINDLNTIVSEEQSRLDALLNIGALTYGVVELNAEGMAMSDIVNGDFSFSFNVTATPLAKSLTAIVNWTDEGFQTYFADFAGNE